MSDLTPTDLLELAARVEGGGWRADEIRRGWVINSLDARTAELRKAEIRCRKAFTQPFMAEPTNHLADAYGKAASVLEAEAESLRALATLEPKG